MEPERIHDLTPAYALDALDAHEAEEFEEHLRHCEHCRTELAELREVTTSLAYGAPAAAAPETLRGRILEQARAERSNVIPFPQRRSRT
ncbi:MAG: zf-HC2 domain-containing protein, partial [Actinobacteria bacterium]|nr:zf-HC2 domain-containing protein [Actinomycetota bacterium]